jgi:hypothetical protein
MAKVVGLSVPTVKRIWKTQALAPHRVRRFKLSNDPKRSSAPQTVHLDRRTRQDPRRGQRRAPNVRVDPLAGLRRGRNRDTRLLNKPSRGSSC